jgi:hypothetical protein
LACSARADVIAGPALIADETGWQFSGIGFKPNVDAVLSSFTFQNQGLADSIELLDQNGNVLESVNVPAGNPSFTAAVDWPLTLGEQYYLLRTTRSNTLYTGWHQSAPGDTQIDITDTGIFSQSVDPKDFGVSGLSLWSSFNNITTDSAWTDPPVPEPKGAVWATLLVALLAVTIRKSNSNRI